MVAKRHSPPSCFDANQSDILVGKKLIKGPNRIRPSADTGDHCARQTAFLLEDLPSHLFADNAVKVANHGWVGMRAEDTAEKIMSGADVGHPIAHRLVDRILERLRAR